MNVILSDDFIWVGESKVSVPTPSAQMNRDLDPKFVSLEGGTLFPSFTVPGTLAGAGSPLWPSELCATYCLPKKRAPHPWSPFPPITSALWQVKVLLMGPQSPLASEGLCSEHLLWGGDHSRLPRDAQALLPAGAHLAASQVCPLCPRAPSSPPAASLASLCSWMYLTSPT